MNIKMIKNIILSLCLVSLVSCADDFLELNPHQSVSLDGAIQSVDDYNAAIYGTYSAMQSSNYYGRYFVLVPDVMSDDVKQNSQANRARDFSDYVVNSNDGIASGMFNTIYNTILRANTVINAKAEIPAAVKAQVDQVVGEAYAIRALAHFDLVRMFAQHYGFSSGNTHAGISIVTEFDQNSKPGRNTVAEVYAQVLSDLNQAITLMTIKPPKTSRFSKEAAQALLARVYLYMGDFAKAEAAASSVISSNKFSLVTNANYIKGWENGFSSESIFEVAFNSVDNNGSDALGRMYIVEGYGDYLPSQDVLGLIPAGDVRLGLFKADKNLSGPYGTVRMNKYPSTLGINNTVVLRLSEMYLIRAEARAKTGNEAGAIEDLNRIRKRGLATAADVSATGAALVTEIEKERRIELMFEGHRLWDLMRNKRNLTRTNCTNSVCTLTYPNDRFVAPIPQSEMDANTNMTQNPGY